MFELDLRSRAPIYEQLVDKIIELIISDVLKPDQQLPSVCILSSELTLNPNTIQKAYRELEYRGYIYSLPGKGSFVRPALAEDNSARLLNLEKELNRIITEMLYLGLRPDEILARAEDLLSAAKGGNIND